MNKILGILPYLYFFDEPIQLGQVNFFSLPDTKGRKFTPKEKLDNECLHELINCFPVHRGLQSNKGVIRSFSYFLVDECGKDISKPQIEARKAITLLRYSMLSPDNQTLNDMESSVLYTFELPPYSSAENRIYHGWVNFNHEEWVTPSHHKFCPPGWNVDFQTVHTSNLDDIATIKERFYNNVLDKSIENNILLAIDWYNLSFLKYSPRGLVGRLVDISIAFDTLFRLQENKSTLYDCINQTLGVVTGTPLERWSRDFYGKVRSSTMHFGKPASLVFKHEEATEGHVSFLWTAQRIFRECVAVKAELDRKISNKQLIEELTPNEVVLKELRALGSYENLKKTGNRGIWKLRQSYPIGDKDNIIWLGSTLLGEFAKQIPRSSVPSLAKVVDSILQSSPDDENLWSKYVQLDKELSDILFRGDIENAATLSEGLMLAYDVSKFANFAWYALQMLTISKKRK
jgi:hypothetical protein